jgi:hypothetical protein
MLAEAQASAIIMAGEICRLHRALAAQFFDMYGAQERTRTSTPLRELAPEASASANSATWALSDAKRGKSILPRAPSFVNEAQSREESLTGTRPSAYIA